MLKMAPNSLFAILLRSSWWISLGIALTLGLLSRALLPSAYWVFGAMSGIPFAVIGALALRKQWGRPSEQRTAAILQSVSALAWRDFAAALEQAFRRDGYSVERLEGGGAADLVLTRGGRTTLVAAKRWKAARHGTEALQALLDATRARDASECHYVALGELSEQAKRLAKQHNIQLVQGVALAQLLRDLKVA